MADIDRAHKWLALAHTASQLNHALAETDVRVSAVKMKMISLIEDCINKAEACTKELDNLNAV